MPLGRPDDDDLGSCFCHACYRVAIPRRLPLPHCPYCNSAVVEQAEPSDSSDSPRNWLLAVADNYPQELRSAIQYGSPPIRGTRDRYLQQVRDAHLDSVSPFSNLNMYGQLPNPDYPDNDSSRSSFHRRPTPDYLDNHSSPSSFHPHPSPPRRPYPDSHPTPPAPRPPRNQPRPRFNIADFLPEYQNQAPRSRDRPSPSGTRFGFSRRPSIPTSSPGSQTHSPTHPTPPTMPAQLPGELAGGVYTFTFDSRSPTPAFSFQPTQPRQPHVPQPGDQEQPEPDRPHPNTDGQPALHGLFTLLQNAFGLTGQNTQTDQVSPESADHSEPPSGRASPHAHTGPTAAAPGVTLEDGHPLRQFIDLLGTLSRADGRGPGPGFVFNGGTGFGFAAPRNMGDYVTSESAMQEILNQLINVAGNGASASPPPASEAQIKQLRRFAFSQSGDEPVECAICKDTFEVGDECLELPCKHFFHSEDCIGMWLKQNGTCPVCRFSLVTGEQGSPVGVERGAGPSRERQTDELNPSTLSSSTSSSSSPSRPTRRDSNRFTMSSGNEMHTDDDDEWQDIVGDGGMDLRFDVD